MIKTMNFNRSYTAVLENAYNISYDKKSNIIWEASFSLPINDPKNSKVKQLQYVEIIDSATDEYIGLFRVMPKLTSKYSNRNEINYKCQHVLGTLMDSVMFKYHQLAGFDTTESLEYVLSKQDTMHWQLGQVDFTRFFHYGWENENLLTALFSIPRPFDQQYIWTWDTTSYPWTLNLVEPETAVSCRILETYNLQGFDIEENPYSLVNRIYPLGAGEGVNQLDIRTVNSGIPYVEDAASIAQYGLIEHIWADRRFTDKESLKSSAIAMLDKYKQPIITWKAVAADVARLTGISLDELRLNKVVHIETLEFGSVELRIVRESKPDITGDPGTINLEMGNVSSDLSTTATDTETRHQINELYSQGATNILNFDYQDNCDPQYPAVIEFFIDDDVVNVNTIELTYATKPFRAYSKATLGGGGTVGSTASGGGTVGSTASGGGSTQTSGVGGQSTQTSSSGGGTTTSSAAGGDHDHLMFEMVEGPTPAGRDATLNAGGGGSVYTQISLMGNTFKTATSSGNHSHNVTIPNHTHDVTTPAHSHAVNIPDHSHNIDIPDHSHNIDIPEHFHDIDYGIWESPTTANNIEIKIDGVVIPINSTSGQRVDIVDYLSKDGDGKITRGTHKVEMKPNTIARIEAQLISRLFIRSQLGGEF